MPPLVPALWAAAALARAAVAPGDAPPPAPAAPAPLPAPAAPTPFPAPAVQDAPRWAENELHWYWKDGLRFETADRDLAFQLFGRVQVDAAWIAGKDELEAAEPGSTDDGVEIRRARLGISGDVHDWFFKAEYDFVGESVRFMDVLLGRSDVAGSGVDAWIGHFKEPVALNELTNPNFRTFVENAAPVEAFAPVRNVGVGFRRAFADGRAQATLGVFKEDADDQGLAKEDGGYAVTGRVSGAPILDEDSVLHLGLSCSLRDDEEARFRSRPEVHLTERFVDTGTLDSEDTLLAGLELGGVAGPVHAAAEYLVAEVDGDEDPSFSGWYAQVGWFLTGERRPYRAGSGTWGRVVPRERFGAGGPGAIELAARYSALDLDDEDVAGGEQDGVTLGVNWYPSANVRVMANYVASDVDTPAADEGFDAFLMRFQVDW